MMTNIEIQELLIVHRLLDPHADGLWGNQSAKALRVFQELLAIPPTGIADGGTKVALAQHKEILPLILGDDFASRIIRRCLDLGFWIPVGPLAFTIVYVEGVDSGGRFNNDEPNEWNDRRIVIEIPNGRPIIVGNWKATSEPGTFYTHNRMNPAGAARIKFGQYKAWQVGLHCSNPYEALEQVVPIHVYRDDNEDYARTGDVLDEGLFGVNQHHGYDSPSVDANSAGCLVGQSVAGHEEFMEIIKSDRRYKANPAYTFYTAVIPGDNL